MDSDGLPIVGPAIDLTQVTSINQKRTIAFLNHFIAHTVSFLNRFSCVCEEKLSELSNRLQRVDITLSILEAKLASIPGLENVTAEANTTTSSTVRQQPTSTSNQAAEPPSTTNQEPDRPMEVEETPEHAEERQEPAKPAMTVANDPRYKKYFQMMKVGVPLAALRPKVIADGLDPDLLENPDAPAPGADQMSDDSDAEESSASSFTDEDD